MEKSNQIAVTWALTCLEILPEIYSRRKFHFLFFVLEYRVNPFDKAKDGWIKEKFRILTEVQNSNLKFFNFLFGTIYKFVSISGNF